MEALDRARNVLARWDEQLQRELPEGAEVFDAHVHLGEDVDGMAGRYEDLIDVATEVSKAFADAKSNLEASAFITGSGSGEPMGGTLKRCCTLK